MAEQAKDDWNYYETLESDDPQYKKWYDESVGALGQIVRVIDSDHFINKDGWTLAAENGEHGYKVWYKAGVQNNGKTFIGMGEFEANARTLFNELWENLESTPAWNEDLIEYKRVKMVGKQTDIVYSAFKDMPLISSRDFVNVRCWRKMSDGSLGIGSVSTECEAAGSVKGRVRGLESPGITRITPHPDKPGWVTLEFSVNTDLKGFLPKKLTDQVMHGTIIDYFNSLRERLIQLKPPTTA